jgi:hypothetical protein
MPAGLPLSKKRAVRASLCFSVACEEDSIIGRLQAFENKWFSRMRLKTNNLRAERLYGTLHKNEKPARAGSVSFLSLF